MAWYLSLAGYPQWVTDGTPAEKLLIAQKYVQITEGQVAVALAAYEGGKPYADDPAVQPRVMPGRYLNEVEQRAAFVPRDEYEAGGGGDGPGGYVHTQSSPSASWSINNPLGRIPGVDLYVGGVQVDADITASATTVAVSFPAPTAGIAVLV